jgi:hypothetical protein
MPDFIVDIPAGAWDYPPANWAEWEKLAGANGDMIVDWFDDSTEEYIETQIQIPNNLDASGTIYIEVYGFAKVADGNEIQLRFSHSAKAKGEDWDTAYVNVESGDYVTDAQQDELDFVEWNDTVANFGWAADDHIRIMLSRSAIDDGTPVSGDWGATHCRIRIPTS